MKTAAWNRIISIANIIYDFIMTQSKVLVSVWLNGWIIFILSFLMQFSVCYASTLSEHHDNGKEADHMVIKGNPYKFVTLIATKSIECPSAFQFKTAEQC